MKNRFDKQDRYVWEDHHACYECGQNGADCLHHIFGNSDIEQVPGKHNSSIYNSAPLHNQKCHIGRETSLGKKRKEFLNRTKAYIDNADYQRKERDEKFLEVYSDYYVDNTSDKV